MGEGWGKGNLPLQTKEIKARQNCDSKGKTISTTYIRHTLLSMFFSFQSSYQLCQHPKSYWCCINPKRPFPGMQEDSTHPEPCQLSGHIFSLWQHWHQPGLGVAGSVRVDKWQSSGNKSHFTDWRQMPGQRDWSLCWFCCFQGYSASYSQEAPMCPEAIATQWKKPLK